MLPINMDTMLGIAGEAYDAVLEKVPSDQLAKRWINTIARAVQEFETNPFISYRTQDNTLIFWSHDTTNGIYEVTEKGCECKAARKHQPCKHAAARKLYRRYLETAQ